ncbi:MAG TPA: M20 family metallopeptidase [Candidatus Limnocylindrales bacterium]|nr:M20 family metallopeptidase [Candidatus Limnocylindrales bacterium]
MPASSSNAGSLLSFCTAHQPEMLELLRRFVEMESPSDNKTAVDLLGKALAQEFEKIGGRVTFFPQSEYGDHLKAEFPGESGKPVMLLGHFDTVYPLGTLSNMPFHVEAGRAFGPGVYDMKAGIVMMMFALRALRESGRPLKRPVTVLLDTDEEIGSPTGRPVVEDTARQCEAVLVLEPSQGIKGALKTARKGVGDFTIEVAGRAAHAGVDFEKGHSAVIEAARQILEVAKFTDLGRGLTVNPGVVQGGTRTNVIAAETRVEVDVRIARMRDAVEVEKRFAALKAFDPNCQVRVSGGINRPPMEHTEGTVRLFRLAQEQAAALGMEIDEASTGGGSDGNFTSGLDIPTLDGLGGVGEGAHARHEAILLEELPRRTALLACLLRSL